MTRRLRYVAQLSAPADRLRRPLSTALCAPKPSMANERLKIARTDLANLVANLRGEVGEVITTWLLMRNFMAQAARLASGELEKDVANRDLLFLNLLADKLRDELIGRLSELAEAKVGQLTFYFAAKTVGRFAVEAAAFTDFVVKHRIRDKRNRDISHKQLPERWSDHRHIEIPYRILVRAVVLVLRLMKRMDRHVLGPAAPCSCARRASGATASCLRRAPDTC